MAIPVSPGPEHARGQLRAEPVTARQPQTPGYCLLINLLIMFRFNPRAWRRCGNVRHLFMPRVAGGVTKAASRRCHRASPGPAGCHRAAASASAASHSPGAVSLPQFPPEELGIPGSITLPAPGWPQCQLSPALRGCHRCRACPCPRCRGFVQLKAGPERPLWSHGGFGAIPEPPSRCWDWLCSLWGCHRGCKGDQGSSPCLPQRPRSGLTGKHWGSSPLGRCHPLAGKGTKDGAERFADIQPPGFPAVQNPSGVGAELQQG